MDLVVVVFAPLVLAVGVSGCALVSRGIGGSQISPCTTVMDP